MDGGGQVAVATILDLPGVTEAQYAITRGTLGAAPSPGNLIHVAGPTSDGWRVVEVWKSQALMGAFYQSAAARTAFQAAGIPPAQPAIYHDSTIAAAAYAGR
jgi:hypothetical protein